MAEVRRLLQEGAFDYSSIDAGINVAPENWREGDMAIAEAALAVYETYLP